MLFSFLFLIIHLKYNKMKQSKTTTINRSSFVGFNRHLNLEKPKDAKLFIKSLIRGNVSGYSLIESPVYKAAGSSLLTLLNIRRFLYLRP